MVNQHTHNYNQMSLLLYVHDCILIAKSENSLHEKIEEDGNLI